MKIVEYIKKHHRLALISLAVILIVAAIAYFSLKRSSNIYEVKKDNFEAIVSCKGEIQSEKSLLISFPDILSDRTLGIYQSQIKDLVTEGTIVKKGDYVALLDEGRIKQLTQQNAENLQKVSATFNDSKLDSAVTLSSNRDELEQLEFDLKYNKIDVEQSVYDSPANQRKTQIAFDRTARLIDSKRRSYRMRQNELKIKCSWNERKLKETEEMDQKYQQALMATRITAPSDGMIIYARNWSGHKTKIGDYVDLWDPAIATLPDLNSLVSETYVEEIYISKIHVGDSVRVHVDALKNKENLAIISNISNIGQDMSGFDSNVFKVYIRLTGDISKFKPSMTTNNDIIIEKAQNVLVIPLISLFTENGSQFVYLKESGKIIKRMVKTGEKNEKMVLLKSGLKEGDKILLSKPKNENI
jgi:multidrug efflux pump subunit AcrA (membrane-fusion protein)